METSVSLLERLAALPTSDDWRRLDDLYRPLLRAWMARAGVSASDVDDLVQDVLFVLSREIAGVSGDSLNRRPTEDTVAASLEDSAPVRYENAVPVLADGAACPSLAQRFQFLGPAFGPLEGKMTQNGVGVRKRVSWVGKEPA
jgi:hypothetical protein